MKLLGAESEAQPTVLPTMGISSRLVQSLSPSRQLLTLCWGLRRSQRGQAPGHTASSRAHRKTPSDHAVVRLEMRRVGSWSAAHSNASVRFCFSAKYNVEVRGGGGDANSVFWKIVTKISCFDNISCFSFVI